MKVAMPDGEPPDGPPEWWRAVESRLLEVARQFLGTSRPGEGQDVDPITVVHWAFMWALRLGLGEGKFDWADRKGIVLAKAKWMICLLVRYRADNPQFDQGGFARILPIQILPLQANFDTNAQFDAEVLASLERLEADHRNASEVAWFRDVCGLTIEQTTELLEVEPRTVFKHSNYARAWLRGDLDRKLKRKRPHGK